MVTSIVRTVVPYIVGALVAVGAYFGVDLPPEALTEVTMPVVAAAAATVYYGVARAAEEYLPERWQRIGKVLLASRRSPGYHTEEEARREIDRIVRDETRKRRPSAP
ncbi:hypothetical protein ACFQZ2_01815 [Streptomonospora algeriensis]|uniref:Holin n=1 Tax=Streptomonospora algeriensis TaxID=995084 RepID=A0ABW3BDP9_9ACTN